MGRFVKRVLGSPLWSALLALGVVVALILIKLHYRMELIETDSLAAAFVMLIGVAYQLFARKWFRAAGSLALGFITMVVSSLAISIILGTVPPPPKWYSTNAKLPDGLGTVTFQKADACPPRLKSIILRQRVRISTPSKTSQWIDLGRTGDPRCLMRVFLASSESGKIIRLNYDRKNVYFDLAKGHTVGDVHQDGELLGKFYRREFIPEYERPKVCGGLYHPSAVAVDRKGSLYVVDRATGMLAKYNANGDFITKWRLDYDDKPYMFDCYDYRVALDSDGHVWAAHWLRHTLSEYSASGKLLRTLGDDDRSSAARIMESIQTGGDVQSSEQEAFEDVVGLAVGTDGSLYINTSKGNGKLHKISPTGRAIWKVSVDKGRDHNYYDPAGISLTPGGHVLIARNEGGVGEYSSDGKLVAHWDTVTKGKHPYDPVDVVSDREGNSYVSLHDGVTGTVIEKHDPKGKFLLSWKPGKWCTKIAAGNGCVYAIDEENRRVLKFTDTGKPIPNWGR